ncbi:MAG TPA: DUF4340 domain-containing protein [Spirochaetota bacterium]|nr:DUF4340 domain-containing protein [Spirochaetota bacterium]HQF07126.1 DUF4340 domain-containing protein [Spirochaetota bacterium]HQH95863.1 DUF4340 domain-containing protein [Spirochaetota bacterium]HQJ72053.1 DUF4340 domain-containing protein [Spirochaetota bacterium]HRS78523.1 DUF4340 domain-containing protein [Spirochaetota bacterium]
MNKKLAISVAVIAVLLLIVIISNVKRSRDVPELPEIKAGSDEILINREAGVIRLFKKDGKWVAGDKAYPADANKAGEIEKRFKEMRLTDLISSKGYYSRYDLTPDKYVEVILKKGDTILRRFKVGKKSPTNRHTFVKIDDRPEIYLAEGTFDMVLNKELDDFRDREVLKVGRDAVSALTVEYQGMNFAFTRTREAKTDTGAGKKNDEKKQKGQAWGSWTCRGYETVKLNDSMVDGLVQALDPLRAASFLDMPKEALTQRVCSVQVKAGEREMILTVYRYNEKYAAATSEYPYVFEVEKYAIERFFITGIDRFRAAVKQ